MLDGGAGDDSLVGGAGEAEMIGGAGNDILDSTVGEGYANYMDSQSPVTVTLGADSCGTVVGGVDVGTDTLVRIEGVVGSAFNDTMTGGSGNDGFMGVGGNDSIDGGTGVDTVYYDKTSSTSGVIVNLSGGPLNGVNINSINPAGTGTVTVQGGTARDGLDSVTGGIGGTDILLNIENVVGSDYNDFLVGSNGANKLEGGHGADTLRGNGGTDTINGGNSSLPGALALSLSEYDWADYANATTLAGGSATAGVNVNLGADTLNGTGSATGYAPATASTSAFSHTLIGIEAVMGSAFNDTITGNAHENMLRGSAGDDTIDGGLGNDWADYANAATSTVAGGTSLVINLATGTASGGNIGIDTLISIERVRGSNLNDTITGTASDNVIRALAGNNAIDGAGGFDVIDYVQASAGVTVNMSNTDVVTGAFTVTASFAGGLTGTDVVKNVEGVQGSRFNDSITGDAGDNRFNSFGGNDTYFGGAGNDLVNYQFATTGMQVNLSTGTASGYTADSLTDIESVRGSEYNDSIVGSSANNTIVGGLGSDTINGGAGNDTIDLTAFNTSGQGTPQGSLVKIDSLLDGTDTILNFTFNDPSWGGDRIDLSGIANLGNTANVAQFYGSGTQDASAYQGKNVIIFEDVAMTQQEAVARVTGNSNVVDQGFLIFKDAGNNNQATIFHSSNMMSDASLQAVVVLAGDVNLNMLHQPNLIL